MNMWCRYKMLGLLMLWREPLLVANQSAREGTHIPTSHPTSLLPQLIFSSLETGRLREFAFALEGRQGNRMRTANNGNGSTSDSLLGITVFSGGTQAHVSLFSVDRLTRTVSLTGTAANSLVSVFNRIVEKKGRQLNYVIPISDNGGSSSELIRVIGGPSEFSLDNYKGVILM